MSMLHVCVSWFAWYIPAPVATSGLWATLLYEHHLTSHSHCQQHWAQMIMFPVHPGGFSHTPFPRVSISPSVSSTCFSSFILRNLASLHSPEVLSLYLHIYVNACSIIPTSYVHNVYGCFYVREETLVKSSWAKEKSKTLKSAFDLKMSSQQCLTIC